MDLRNFILPPIFQGFGELAFNQESFTTKIRFWNERLLIQMLLNVVLKE